MKKEVFPRKRCSAQLKEAGDPIKVLRANFKALEEMKREWLEKLGIRVEQPQEATDF